MDERDKPSTCSNARDETMDWARRRLDQLLEIWEKLDDMRRRSTVRSVARALDAATNPRLKE